MKIQSRAPIRIDLAGGTLDLWPLYLLVDRARTVNLGIDIYATTTLEETQSGKEGVLLESLDQGSSLELSWEELTENRTKAIPPTLELHARFIRLFAENKEPRPHRVRLSTRAQSPAGAGLGGSSGLSISIAGALETWCTGKTVFSTERCEQLIWMARDIEASVLVGPAGFQDYYGAMYGGLQTITWGVGKNGRAVFSDETLLELEKRLLLFYSGKPRNSGINNWLLYKNLVDGVSSVREKFDRIIEATDDLAEALDQKDWAAVGNAIRSEWSVRKTLAEGISTPEMDRAIEKATKAGSTAAKVCGAGGGGCFFVYVDNPSLHRELVRQAVESENEVQSLDFTAVKTGLEVEIH